jgi:hypothetical protein
MNRLPQIFAALLCIVVMRDAASAFEYPLSANAVRDAYFLGQHRDSATADFLAKYAKRLPATKTGWQVVEMEVRTPFSQVVLRSWQSLPGYTPQQAAEEFKKRDPQVIVRLYLSAPISQVIRGNEWRDFLFRVEQEKEIRPRAIFGQPVYSFANGGAATVIGAEVFMELDAAQVQSAPLRVEVKSPDGKMISSEFDLSKLR